VQKQAILCPADDLPDARSITYQHHCFSATGLKINAKANTRYSHRSNEEQIRKFVKWQEKQVKEIETK
jgi:hypothetical protein